MYSSVAFVFCSPFFQIFIKKIFKKMHKDEIGVKDGKQQHWITNYLVSFMQAEDRKTFQGVMKLSAHFALMSKNEVHSAFIN